MIHYMEPRKYKTAHVKIAGFLEGILLGQEYVTVMGSDIIVVGGKVNM